MKSLKYLSGIIVVFLVFLTGINGQNNLDSLVLQRVLMFRDFSKTVDSLKLHSRSNLIQINQRAMKVIDLDNRLIDDFLNRERENNRLLTERAEQLVLELTLLQKEADLNRAIARERSYIMKALLIGTGVILILFIVVLILFIDRQIRFRSIKLELDHSWSVRDSKPQELPDPALILELKSKLELLTVKNHDLGDQIDRLTTKVSEQEDVIENEKTSKKKIEEEIKKLILQIRQQ